MLAIRKFEGTTKIAMGGRAFFCRVPVLWDDLPSSCLGFRRTFKLRLKTHLELNLVDKDVWEGRIMAVDLSG